MAEQRHGLATAQRLEKAFGRGLVVPAATAPIEDLEIDGYAGWANDPVSVTIRCLVGPERKQVEIQTSRMERIRSSWLLAASLLHYVPEKELAAGMFIEPRKMRVNALGRSRTLTGLAIGDRFSGRIEVGEVSIVVKCPEGVPECLALARLEARRSRLS